jgi:hypothetical protein
MAKKPQEQQQQQQEQQAAPAPAAQEPVPAEQAAGQEGGGALMVDFGQVPDQADLPVIPRGIYPAAVDDLQFVYSQNSGNPMWTWILELEESAGEYAGRKLYFHSPFVENMMPRVKKVVSRVYPELLTRGPFNPEEIANSGEMVGKRCQVRVDIGMYENRRRNNVRDILPPKEDSGAGFLPDGGGQAAAA